MTGTPRYDPRSPGERARSMFAPDLALPTLKSISVITQKESVRFAVSALTRSGVAPHDIRTLRDICKPENFKRALDYLAVRLGGPTRTVGDVAEVLAKIAKHSGF